MGDHVYLSVEDIVVMRKRVGLTQAELARAVGVSQAYIARLERGKIDPKLSVVRRIYEYFAEIQHRTCGDVMTPNPVVVDLRDSASYAVDIMIRRGFSQLPVVRGGVAVGILEERDIIRNFSSDLSTLSVGAIIGDSPVPKVDEGSSIDAILPMFETFQAILVERNGRLVGIITRSDILKLKRRMRLSGQA